MMLDIDEDVGQIPFIARRSSQRSLDRGSQGRDDACQPARHNGPLISHHSV